MREHMCSWVTFQSQSRRYEHNEAHTHTHTHTRYMHVCNGSDDIQEQQDEWKRRFLHICIYVHACATIVSHIHTRTFGSLSNSAIYVRSTIFLRSTCVWRSATAITFLHGKSEGNDIHMYHMCIYHSLPRQRLYLCVSHT